LILHGRAVSPVPRAAPWLASRGDFVDCFPGLRPGHLSKGPNARPHGDPGATKGFAPGSPNWSGGRGAVARSARSVRRPDCRSLSDGPPFDTSRLRRDTLRRAQCLAQGKGRCIEGRQDGRVVVPSGQGDWARPTVAQKHDSANAQICVLAQSRSYGPSKQRAQCPNSALAGIWGNMGLSRHLRCEHLTSAFQYRDINLQHNANVKSNHNA
jgi:hypothetical protein